MSLLALRFEEISETDLNALVAQRVPESIALDYKRELVGGSDKDRYEFLADVSSFANTTGGELLFGIEETAGLPTKIVGVDTVNIDQEILRLEQIIRTGSRPHDTALLKEGFSSCLSGRFRYVDLFQNAWQGVQVMSGTNLGPM